jgi:hypothetical protein
VEVEDMSGISIGDWIRFLWVALLLLVTIGLALLFVMLVAGMLG